MPEPGQRQGLWLLAPVALVACCVGHTLLLAAGIGGIGTLIGVTTGNGLLLVVGAATLLAAVALVVMRMRRSRSREQVQETRRD